MKCPRCGIELLDLRDRLFNPRAIEQEGVCFLWNSGKGEFFTCATDENKVSPMPPAMVPGAVWASKKTGTKIRIIALDSPRPGVVTVEHFERKEGPIRAVYGYEFLRREWAPHRP